MRRSTSFFGVLAGAAAIAAVAGTTVRRWERADDASEPDPLVLPDGIERRVPTHDGGALHVRVMGDGPQLFVLVHGWTSDHRVWAPVVRRLVARGHRVATYDLRGHGASTVGGDGHTVTALGHDLARVLDALDAHGAVVAGHSMGGMAVQALALDHPDVMQNRVAAIVLASSACSRVAVGPLAPIVGAAVGSAHLNRFVGHPRMAPYVFRSAIGKGAALAHIRASGDCFVATDATTRSDFFIDMAALDLSERLTALDIPTTIVCGTRDLVLPLARSRHLARLLPHARFEIVPGAGHMVMCERPDLLADLLEDALAPVPAST